MYSLLFSSFQTTNYNLLIGPPSCYLNSQWMWPTLIKLNLIKLEIDLGWLQRGYIAVASLLLGKTGGWLRLVSFLFIYTEKNRG